MSWFSKFRGKLEVRNLASSIVLRPNQTPKPVYTNWTLKKAVSEGYKSNSWVYRSIYLKAKAAGSVKWFVVNKEGEKIENHHITKLLEFPNPHISRQDMFEILVSWLELAGNGYLKKAKTGNKTQELWPISPDRLHPIPTNDVEKWMEGYALDKSKTVTYEPDEIIQFKYFDPANPLIGISPLEVVSKTVDVDNDQRNFNKATSQNRGVVDGMFIFKRKFSTQKETDSVRDALNERHAGKRTFGVVGDEAKYVRTALTPAEMDFIASRKSNREEIFICFGVPPVYAGVMDGATMNNYKTSELVFWFGTMLFLLDDLKDTLNFSLKDELGEGASIVYDISDIPASREAVLAKTKTAKALYDMGVPFDQLNKVFKFGFQEYDGWEDSNPSNSADSESIQTDSKTRAGNAPMEFRATHKSVEKAVEKETKINQKTFTDLMSTQQEAIFDALEIRMDADIEKIIASTDSLWHERMYEMYVKTGTKYGTDFVIETRTAESDVAKEIRSYLDSEAIVLKEVSMISDTTVDKLIKQVSSAIDTGASVSELQQSIIDTGIFSEKRALGLARTISGNAVNLGQWKGAEAAGATHKKWSTASFEVRKTHKKMDGKEVPIDGEFTVGGHKARYPLDNNLPPKERMN